MNMSSGSSSSASMAHRGGGHASMSVGGMSMTAAHGATNILPNWLAIIWTLVYIAVFVTHFRHVLETSGQRRLWHSGHVLMALGMVFMFAPASIDHFNIPTTFWQLAFANAAGVAVAWILAQALNGRPVNVLWVVIAIDLAAMVYMWSSNGFVAPITWLLVAYFASQSLLWISDRMRNVDQHTVPGAGSGFSVTPGGALAVSDTTVEALVCFRDLRATMFLMTLGMAYMFAATQLLT
jgi:hypothetical protein